MSRVTENVANYVNNMGINLTKMSEAINIEYSVLYDSLGAKGRRRDLRDNELLNVCKFLGKNPMDFAEGLTERG